MTGRDSLSAETGDAKYIRAIIVDGRNLIRDSIALLLRSAGPDLNVLEVDRPEDIPTVQGDPRDTVFIVSDMDDDRALTTIDSLSRRAPGIACVMLATGSKPLHAVEVLKHGARGIIGTTTPTQAIPHILRLIVAGGTYVSTETLLELVKNKAVTDSGYPENAETLVRYLPELTRKQLDVTWLLARGWPNTEIAKGLHMRENTVKAHVGQIIRKLGLRNRTEVALMVSRRIAAGAPAK